MTQLLLCLTHLLTGGLLFALPNLSRRNLLFAVPVADGFRSTPEGRKSILEFRRIVVAIVLLGVLAYLIMPVRALNLAPLWLELLTLLGVGIAFYRQHKALRPFAVAISGQRDVDLTTAPEQLPSWAWLGVGPLLILPLAAVFLYLNWDSIPARFPIHWGADGRPNGWSVRNIRGVYGPLFIAAPVSVWILVMGLAGWFGSRRSRTRPVMLGAMIATANFIAGVFAAVAVRPLLGFPIWIILLASMAFSIGLLFVVVGKFNEPGDPLEPTPNECWKGGVIYYNPQDAALFVEKRDGIGYTFNFANRWSWALLGSLLLISLVIPLWMAI